MDDDFHQAEVETEYRSFGPFSATATPDGQFVLIDFVNMDDTTKALRLAIPSAAIENCIAALQHLQKALGDPTSGVHFQERH